MNLENRNLVNLFLELTVCPMVWFGIGQSSKPARVGGRSGRRSQTQLLCRRIAPPGGGIFKAVSFLGAAAAAVASVAAHSKLHPEKMSGRFPSISVVPFLQKEGSPSVALL